MKFKNPSEYIASFPENIRKFLNEFREIIITQIPEAKEVMAYGIVGYKLKGKPLVYFSGNKNHIGFYATPTGNSQFKTKLKGYKTGKGSIQFPLNEPLPKGLIIEILNFREKEITSNS